MRHHPSRRAHLSSQQNKSAKWVSLASVTAGLGGAWWFTRYLQSMLYSVTALDSVTFVTMPVVLAALAIAASFAPDWRASRTDPTIALRDE